MTVALQIKDIVMFFILYEEFTKTCSEADVILKLNYNMFKKVT